MCVCVYVCAPPPHVGVCACVWACARGRVCLCACARAGMFACVLHSLGLMSSLSSPFLVNLYYFAVLLVDILPLLLFL